MWLAAAACAAIVASASASSDVDVLVGAHYFGGWYYEPPQNYSHFHGFTPTGAPTLNFFDSYPSRIPLLGNLTTSEATVAAEIKAADRALDFFDVLYYDMRHGDCGYNPDPNLRDCINTALAWMTNSTTAWEGVKRLHFFISYSNDVDRASGGKLVGPAGDAVWASLVGTWVRAMKHPRYLKVNGRPVFKVLIPDIFVFECGGDAALAMQRIAELRSAAVAAGLGEPLVGGGWQNPSIPASQPPPDSRPHPNGYMVYNHTNVLCGPSCVVSTSTVADVVGCERACNTSAKCTAFTITAMSEDRRDNTGSVASRSFGADSKPSASLPSQRSSSPSLPSSSPEGQLTCTLKSVAGPGSPDPSVDTYVRAHGMVQWEWTGTYNAAPPICPGQPNDVCSRYVDSWFPNATPTGAKVFPYRECGDYQGAARTNHSVDQQPYLANVIAGFDPRPWEEHAPSFAMPTEAEWEAVLVQVKAQCLNASNRFGFPDASAPQGYQPAFNIYAWNEYGEGGIMAPTRGEGTMKLDVIAKVFGRG